MQIIALKFFKLEQKSRRLQFTGRSKSKEQIQNKGNPWRKSFLKFFTYNIQEFSMANFLFSYCGHNYFVLSNQKLRLFFYLWLRGNSSDIRMEIDSTSIFNAR